MQGLSSAGIIEVRWAEVSKRLVAALDRDGNGCALSSLLRELLWSRLAAHQFLAAHAAPACCAGRRRLKERAVVLQALQCCGCEGHAEVGLVDDIRGTYLVPITAAGCCWVHSVVPRTLLLCPDQRDWHPLRGVLRQHQVAIKAYTHTSPKCSALEHHTSVIAGALRRRWGGPGAHVQRGLGCTGCSAFYLRALLTAATCPPPQGVPDVAGFLAGFTLGLRIL
jgi:hypothetical protein